ncbi:MAG: DUF1622 domain-containing protein [Microcystaceae cyanobacterium]
MLASNITRLIPILSQTLISLCQLLAIFVITTGLVRSMVIFLRDLLLKPQSDSAFQQSRLAMGYSFSLGLSVLVGASILQTMYSNQWDDIARLISIIGVRTLLNYLLMRAINSSNSKPTESPQTIDESTI